MEQQSSSQNNPAPWDKPVLLWDGDCGFCRRWVARWRGQTLGRVEFRPYQEAENLPVELTHDVLQRKVHLIEPNREVSAGAEAIMRVMAHGGHRTGLWMYRTVPSFSAASECVYRIVAENRMFASKLTKLFWGDVVNQPQYSIASWIFRRLLGIVYLVAFASMWSQVDGLIGASGILPADTLLNAARDDLGATALLRVPSVFWLLGAQSWALHGVCALGVLLAVLLTVGVTPLLSITGLWVCYLSLCSVGQVFLGYQWDTLLLESSLIALFITPRSWRDLNASHFVPTRCGVWLAHFLLFRLMWGSGLSKVLSGDRTWRDLTALQYHYTTQPLPHALSWCAQKSPAIVHHALCLWVLVIELALPFLIFAPRRLRLLACYAFCALQLGIFASGNYGFFNLLSIALSLLLMDDQSWPLSRARQRAQEMSRQSSAGMRGAVAIISVLGAFQFVYRFERTPQVFEPIARQLAPLRTINSYGLFAVMTTTRREIELQGSMDGKHWQTYHFKFKPGSVHHAPRFAGLHMPRLDWQMWFAALGNYTHNVWLLHLMQQLMQSTPQVTRLFEPNTLHKPHYIRALFYEYTFSSAADQHAHGTWWTRHYLGLYAPTLTSDTMH